MAIKNPNQVEIQYSESPNYNSSYISGIFGGINTSGMLEIDFFTDRLSRPKSTIHKIENGNIGSEMESEQEHHLHARKVEFTAMMNLEVAKSVQAWLMEKISALEQLSQQSGKQL
ncbi:MAG: hypothetical protein EOP53_09665 [Sphingobacteriales bacterium]|nr:MAG: hypothetical protein EOP53_09665 [Sphingobacteriales bacterium]